MINFDPAWSIVFDAAVGAGLVWVAYLLSRRAAFKRAGRIELMCLAAAIALVLMYFSKWVSLIASGIIVPLLVILAYNDTEQPLSPMSRRLLATARIIVFALVVICLLRPRIEVQKVDLHKAVSMVMVDVSESMSVTDCPPAKSRFDAASMIFKDNAKALEDIAKESDYRLGVFSEKYERAEKLPERPLGKRTNLAETFFGALTDIGGARVAGIVLLTDGRNNGVSDPVAAAVRLGAPIYPVIIGEEGSAAGFADSAIHNIVCPEKVFVKNTAPVVIRVGYTGAPTGEEIEVTLKADGEQVDSKRIQLPASGGTTDVTINYIPKTEGLKKLSASVTPVKNDANVRNNERELYVRATDQMLRVLFVEGEVRWEYKFLRRAISGAENISVTCVNAFLFDEDERHRLLPQNEDDWAQLSLIIIGDVPASRFSADQHERLRKFVAEGGSLLMLGGFSTLGPGGYANSAVGRTLPVDMTANDEQTLSAVQVVPAPGAVDHPILAFGSAEDTDKIWGALPPISGYTKFAGLKPAARVLVQTPEKTPILIVQEYERGRTAVFAADTTWRWIFNEGKFATYHRAFWRQMVHWLTKSQYGGNVSGIWVETDKLRYLPGETPIITVRSSGPKVQDAEISAVIKEPDGQTSDLPVGRGAGLFTFGLVKPVEKPGAYEIVVTAKAAGGDLSIETKFVVHDIDIEIEEPGADLKLLESIAAATGGRVFHLKDAGRALDAVLANSEGTKIVRPQYKRLWDNTWIYIALCGLLSVEWVVRKRRGLA